MDKDILGEAIGQMRGDMRKRVGKKLLTIEIMAGEDGTPSGAEVKGPEEEDPEEE